MKDYLPCIYISTNVITVECRYVKCFAILLNHFHVFYHVLINVSTHAVILLLLLLKSKYNYYIIIKGLCSIIKIAVVYCCFGSVQIQNRFYFIN